MDKNTNKNCGRNSEKTNNRSEFAEEYIIETSKGKTKKNSKTSGNKENR